MARINLLPWRQEQRQRKNKEFLTLVVMITLLALAAAFASWMAFKNQLEAQQTANELITQENTRLDGVLKEIEDLEKRREEIISRMKVIQNLQGRRPVPVRVWDDLARAMPEPLFLKEIKREGNLIILTGRADNPNVVSNLISNLDASEWMGSSAVRNIKKDKEKFFTGKEDETIYPENNYVEFIITTQVETSTKKENEEGEDDTSEETGGDQ